MRYELTNFEWAAIRPFLPNKPRGVPRVNDRRVLNGIFLDIAVRRTMARSASRLRALHDLLQSIRSLANGWHLGHDHGGPRRSS
jgi:transposase